MLLVAYSDATISETAMLPSVVAEQAAMQQGLRWRPSQENNAILQLYICFVTIDLRFCYQSTNVFEGITWLVIEITSGEYFGHITLEK
jgi:hypothetical protein